MIERGGATGGEASARPKLAMLACVVGMMSSLVAILLGTFPLFLQPVSATMGWDRTTFPAIIMVIALSGALIGPLIGRLIDRVGARSAGIAGTLLWGFGLILLSRLGPSLPLTAVTVACLGIGGGLAGQLVYAHVISSWFVNNRGVVLGFVLGTAPALSQALAAPVASALIRSEGWRSAYLALGIFVLGVTLVLNLLFLREPGRHSATAAIAETADGLTAGAALATARFWLLTLATALGTCVYNGVFQHSVAILADKGLASGVGTALVSVTALAAIPSPLLAGFLLDRVRSPRFAVVPFLAAALLGTAIIAYQQGAAWILGAGVLLGLCLGAGPVIQPFLLTRYFGSKAQSELFGISLLGIIGGTAVGPVVMGAIYDRFGSYAPGLLTFQLLAAVAIAFGLLLPSYGNKAEA